MSARPGPRAPDGSLLLQPKVSWPRQMTVGRRHLVEVNLALVTPDGAPAVWPLEEEEYVYTCVLDGGDFDLWAVHDASVVLHRFGGSYGPAAFVVTPRQAKTGERSLWLTFVNQWGVPVGVHELHVCVRAADVSESPGPATPDVGYQDPDHREVREAIAGQARAEPAAPGRDDGERRPGRLAEQYSLVGLRRSPSGNLHWDMTPLFSPGAVTGTRVTFTARCAPSDERGTIFAVIAEPPPGSAWPEPQLRSMQSAKVPPGIYRVTAELLDPFPGRVRFDGLPVLARDEFRGWPEISASVPRRLAPGTGPAHLIAAIETSGPGRLVAERIDRVRQLFEHVAAEAEGFVCYSVISYGPHSISAHNAEYPEVPATTQVWAETADAALGVLARLRRRPSPTGYAAAAQLECVLTHLEDQLTGREGRPVLVTAGTRPAHPPRVDLDSEIIPCPRHNDWRGPMERMRARHVGMAFGAIHDSDWPDELWRVLGADTPLEDFSASGLANALGLIASSAQLIPLPMFSG